MTHEKYTAYSITYCLKEILLIIIFLNLWCNKLHMFFWNFIHATENH